jgi:type II secretory pathway component PulJ
MLNRHHTAGFTFLEVLIVIGLGGVLLLVMTNFFIFGLIESNSTDSRAQLYDEARQAAETISADIQKAQAVAVGSASTSVALEVPTVNSSQQIVYFDHDGARNQPCLNTIIYSSVGSSIQRLTTYPTPGTCRDPAWQDPESLSSTSTILNNLKLLGFALSYEDKNGTPSPLGSLTTQAIKFTITTSLTRYNREVTATVTSRARLRNKL